MNRRDFFKGALATVAAGVVTAKTVSADWAVRTYRRLTFTEIVIETLRKNPDKLVANITQQNALLARIAEADRASQIRSPHLWKRTKSIELNG